MKTIKISTWGKMGLGTITVRVPSDGYTTECQAIASSIERRTGLSFCGGPRNEGASMDSHGRPESTHYQGTLGRPCRTGGYSVEGEIWFAVPVCTL
jgi:hypothetical protein